MVEVLSINDILKLINILLGFLLALLGVKYMKFYSQLNEWWRRLLLLAFIFILGEVVAFMGFEFFAIVMKTVFLGYFLYFLSYITTVVREIDTAKAETARLKVRLEEIKVLEEAQEGE